jgi:hypothetical protein
MSMLIAEELEVDLRRIPEAAPERQAHANPYRIPGHWRLNVRARVLGAAGVAPARLLASC